MADGRVGAKFGHGGVVVGELLLDLHGLAELGLGLPRFARLRQQDAEVDVVGRESAAEICDRGIVPGQLSVDRHGVAVMGLRLRRLAGLRQQIPEVVVANRELNAEGGDGGIVVGELLLDRQGSAILGLGLRQLAGPLQEEANPVDRVRQAAPGVVPTFGRAHQRFLVGSGQAVSGQSLVVLPRAVEEVSPPRPASRQGGHRPRG